MIKKIKKAFSAAIRSLRIGMLFTIALSLVLSLSVAVLIHTIFIDWIENSYNSNESKSERYNGYIEDLQAFVSKYKLSSGDTAEIARWVRGNRNVYLFIYKDNQLFFDSSADLFPDTGEDVKTDSSDNEEENTENGEAPDSDAKDSADDTESGGNDSGDAPSDGESGDNTPSLDGSEAGDNDNTNDTDDADNTDNTSSSDSSHDTKNDKTDEKEDNINSGFTVEYPTREEIIATAQSNGLSPLELSDGTLFVSLADFTDYIYYDVANIVSIAAFVLILVLVLMLYFQNIISRISRLAKDVSLVYEVDMNKKIRTEKGNDELSALTRNVEQMRSSMMESLENEKAAINANTELITAMSHDIRTPLTVLLGYLDIMKSCECSETMREYIKASEQTALRLKELSDDMFRYFLVSANKEMTVNIVDYDAKTLVEQLFSEHILLAREKGYDIVMDAEDSVKGTTRVLTDAPKIMRVVDNLFSNIYKYADRERAITLSAAVYRGKLAITLKNYIPEIPNESECNRVGLKTCSKLCEALGMGFEYESLQTKDGKIFCVRMDFPIKRDNNGEG